VAAERDGLIQRQAGALFFGGEQGAGVVGRPEGGEIPLAPP
jgi:hypothetical protein